MSVKHKWNKLRKVMQQKVKLTSSVKLSTTTSFLEFLDSYLCLAMAWLAAISSLNVLANDRPMMLLNWPIMDKERPKMETEDIEKEMF